jgi:ribosomal-protein-alanine N-acetyltransferase
VEWKTDRLLIRRARLEDWKAYCRMRNSEYVMKYNVMEVQPQEKLWEQVAEDVGSDRAFYLEDRASGKLVGAVWLDRDSLRYGVESATLEYFLGREYAGQGLMTEALEAILRHAFDSLKLEVVSARVFAGNAGSQRVLEKLGFVKEGVLRRAIRGYGGVVHNDMLFSLLREEWKQRQG